MGEIRNRYGFEPLLSTMPKPLTPAPWQVELHERLDLIRADAEASGFTEKPKHRGVGYTKPKPKRRRRDPRHAKDDPFHQMCCALRNWWKCPGVPRLDVLKTYLARNRQLWRLHDEGDAKRKIAREMGITEGDVRYHLKRGRGWLSTVAAGVYRLSRVRSARNTVTQESAGAAWFKAGGTWYNGWYAVNKQGNHQENHQQDISGLQLVVQN